MTDSKPKLPPGMIAPTMAARLTHFFHALRAEGIQERAAKRREKLGAGELTILPSRKERRAIERKHGKSKTREGKK